jgi:hypothetical protein
MPKKPAPKDAKKRTKKPGKIADLPAKSLKGKDAAAVKGGITIGTTAATLGSTALKISPTALKIDSTAINTEKF